jgi:hypothetical protein
LFISFFKVVPGNTGGGPRRSKEEKLKEMTEAELRDAGFVDELRLLQEKERVAESRRRSWQQSELEKEIVLNAITSDSIETTNIHDAFSIQIIRSQFSTES